MVTPTARGTTSSKVSGDELVIPSFTVPAGHSLAVFGGYDNAQTAPVSVKHAGRDLRLRRQRDDAVNGFHASWWLKGEYRAAQTGTCVLKWASAIGKRAAFATSFDAIFKEDDDASALTAASTAPVTGLTGVLDGATPFAICGFAAEAPGSEAGSGETAEIKDGGSFQTATLGQSDGTAGAPPPSNVVAVESRLELTTQDATEGRLQTWVNARNWIGLILVLEPRPALSRHGLSVSDVDAASAFATEPDDVLFGWNEGTGEYEAFEIPSPGTPIARYDDFDGWVVP